MNRYLRSNKSIGMLPLVAGICMLIVMSLGPLPLSAQVIQPQLQPQPRPAPSPAFTSTVPSPLRLFPATDTRFTIMGTNLTSGYITSLKMVCSQNPCVQLPVRILSKSSTAITAAVKVPKYLAAGPYNIVTSYSLISEANTGLIAQADERKPSAVWSVFNPVQHGFSFVNNRWADVCFTIVDGRMEYSQPGPFCGSDWGLCGGMSLNAGERFRSGGCLRTHVLSQDAAKPDVVNAQFRTLDGPTVAKFFEWMYSPDVGHTTDIHSVGHRMMLDWDGLIKPRLDAYRPVVLGLIFDKMATLVSRLDPRNVSDLTKQHQVLGIGYTRIGSSTVRLIAYDPNIPDDILILTFTMPNTGVAQERDSGLALPPDRRPVRGVMFVRSVP